MNAHAAHHLSHDDGIFILWPVLWPVVPSKSIQWFNEVSISFWKIEKIDAALKRLFFIDLAMSFYTLVDVEELLGHVYFLLF